MELAENFVKISDCQEILPSIFKPKLDKYMKLTNVQISIKIL